MRRFSMVLMVIGLMASFIASCADDPFEAVASSGTLEFSRDTVYLDTVFSNISSSTRSFKVYNRSNQNILIPSIGLEGGQSSGYRLNVNGVAGKEFEDVRLLARDSIYILVEVTADVESLSDPLYVDRVLFDEGERRQSVELVTLIQDAHFLFPQRDAQGIKEQIVLGRDENGDPITVDGFYLEEDEVWNDEKPYVVYGYVGVNRDRVLRITPGANIYFHQNSGLLVEKGGRLEAKGSLDKKIVFQGDRLEAAFQRVPGQWGTIWLRSGSGVNLLENVEVKNATVGVLIDSLRDALSLTAKLNNLEVYNTSQVGVLCRGARVEARNLVIGNNGSASLACIEGGDYRFVHTTLGNYWSNSVRNLPSLVLSNGGSPDGALTALNSAALEAQLENCIVEGSKAIEFVLVDDGQAGFEFSIANSLLRFNDGSGQTAGDPLYDFEDQSKYRNNVFNGEADFFNPANADLRIGTESDAVLLADPTFSQDVPLDLLGVNRLSAPDSGAYQNAAPENP